MNRLKQFSLDNNMSICSDYELDSVYSGFSFLNPITKLNNLAINGDVSIDFKNKLVEFNGLLNQLTTNLEIFNTSKEFEIDISVSNLILEEGELELLYSIVSGVKYTASYLVDNNQTSLPILQAIPCGVAMLGYQALL